MNRRTLLLSGTAAVLGLGGWYVSTRGTPLGDALVAPANAQTTDEEIDTSTVTEMVIGDPDAAVEVIEYASFTCPHCAAFHAGAYKELKRDFIDTGKIRFVYRDVYFDRFGLWAAMVARCGGPEKFFGIADLIYAGQSTWTAAGEPAAIVAELRKIGRLAGMDDATLDACLEDGDKARTLVAWYKENVEADGIERTPTFVINGEKYGNMPYSEMKTVLDSALER